MVGIGGLDSVDHFGNTIAHFAASFRNFNLLSWLGTRQCASGGIRSIFAQNFYHFAIADFPARSSPYSWPARLTTPKQYEQLDTIMSQLNVDPFEQDNFGRTVFHHAALFDHPGFKVLMSSPQYQPAMASMQSIVDSDGLSLLHLAAKSMDFYDSIAIVLAVFPDLSSYVEPQRHRTYLHLLLEAQQQPRSNRPWLPEKKNKSRLNKLLELHYTSPAVMLPDLDSNFLLPYLARLPHELLRQPIEPIMEASKDDRNIFLILTSAPSGIILR